MKTGTKVLVNIMLCSSCTENDTFEFCECPKECNQTRLKDLDVIDLELDVIVNYNEFSDCHETENHRILEDYEFITQEEFIAQLKLKG